MDIGQKLKGIWDIFVKIFKGIRDTWINFWNMGIQCFLNFGDICHIYFRDMGFFFKIIKGIWDTGTPSFQGFIIKCSELARFENIRRSPVVMFNSTEHGIHPAHKC